MAFKLIQDKIGEPPIYLGTDEDLAMTDEELASALPGAAVGTIISTAGFKTMKQLDPEGAWASFDEEA